MEFGFVPDEGGRYEHTVSQATTAEEVGFDSIWTAEHHVSEADKYWPAPLLRLGGIATVTDDLRLVTGINILPLHHAVEVAETCAVLDRMSNGRLTYGAGIGYIEKEFEVFGISMDDRAGRLVEGLQVIDRYLSADGPISFDGQFYSFEDLQPLPTSVQDPRPPMILGGWGDLALKRSVALADGWLPGPTVDIDGLAERQKKLRSLCADRGVNWADFAKPAMREAVVAKTTEEALELGREHLYPAYTEEYGTGEWSHPLITEEVVRDFETLLENRFLVGTPAEVIEQIDSFTSDVEIDHLCCRFHGTNDDFKTQLELVGDEVLPALS